MALTKAKNGKAAGPSEVTTEMFTASGDLGLNLLVSVFRAILEETKHPMTGMRALPFPSSKARETL